MNNQISYTKEFLSLALKMIKFYVSGSGKVTVLSDLTGGFVMVSC